MRRLVLLGLIGVLILAGGLPVKATQTNAPNDGFDYVGKTLIVTGGPLEVEVLCGNSLRVYRVVVVDGGGGPTEPGGGGQAELVMIGFFAGAADVGDRFLVVGQNTCISDPSRTELDVLRVSTGVGR